MIEYSAGTHDAPGAIDISTGHGSLPSNIQVKMFYNPQYMTDELCVSFDYKNEKFGMSLKFPSGEVHKSGFKESLITNFSNRYKNELKWSQYVKELFQIELRYLLNKSNISEQIVEMPFTIYNTTIHNISIDSKANKLPAMDTRVDYPCDCNGGQQTVYRMVQHLNDYEKWTRDRIADWIDRMHDAGIIDAEFKTEPEPPVVTEVPKYAKGGYVGNPFGDYKLTDEVTYSKHQFDAFNYYANTLKAPNLLDGDIS